MQCKYLFLRWRSIAQCHHREPDAAQSAAIPVSSSRFRYISSSKLQSRRKTFIIIASEWQWNIIDQIFLTVETKSSPPHSLSLWPSSSLSSSKSRAASSIGSMVNPLSLKGELDIFATESGCGGNILLFILIINQRNSSPDEYDLEMKFFLRLLGVKSRFFSLTAPFITVCKCAKVRKIQRTLQNSLKVRTASCSVSPESCSWWTSSISSVSSLYQ